MKTKTVDKISRVLIFTALAWLGCLLFVGCSGMQTSAGVEICKEHSDGSKVCIAIEGEHVALERARN